MSICKFAGIVTLALFLGTAVAGEHAAKQDKPSISASQTMKVTVQVESVDYETRVVSLREPGGELLTFTAGEEVRNLAQMKAGDIVTAEYTENLYIDVFEDLGTVPSESDFTAMGTAAEGQKPGLTAFDSQVVTAKVEEINLEANTFKLRWPDNSVEEFTARSPENLKMAAVGDMVVITQTVSVNISVEETNVE